MSQMETLQEVQRAGNERLYPSLTNPNWLVLRRRRELFRRWLSALPGSSLAVLDIGGRIQPYRVLLADRCAKYVAIDLQATPLVDLIGRAEQLPLADAQFDLIFCTQVLEYVPDPRAAIAEIHRVLKPGGFLLLSVPFVFPRDSELEYWRFLPAAIRQLLAAFASVEVAPEGNSAVGVVRTMGVSLVTFAKPAVLGALLRFTMVPMLNLLGVLLEFITPAGDDRFTANFSALAKK